MVNLESDKTDFMNRDDLDLLRTQTMSTTSSAVVTLQAMPTKPAEPEVLPMSEPQADDEPVYFVSTYRRLSLHGWKYKTHNLPILLPEGEVTQVEREYMFKRMVAEPHHFVGTKEDLMALDITFNCTNERVSVETLFEYACDVTHYKTKDVERFIDNFTGIIPSPEIMLENLLRSLCEHGVFTFCNVKVVKEGVRNAHIPKQCVTCHPSEFLDKMLRFQTKRLMVMHGLIDEIGRTEMARRLLVRLMKRVATNVRYDEPDASGLEDYVQ